MEVMTKRSTEGGRRRGKGPGAGGSTACDEAEHSGVSVRLSNRTRGQICLSRGRKEKTRRKWEDEEEEEEERLAGVV